MSLFNVKGSERISSLIKQAVENCSRTAVVNGNWFIDKEIRIPDNFRLCLESCHLRMADGVYSNMFVNEHHDTEIGRTSDGTDRNIIIEGNNAVLDGGNYNGLSEKNHSQNGLPPIWKNNLLLFTNVDGFRISGLRCINQRWWALNFIYCCNGQLENIDFCSDDSWIDSDGTVNHGLVRGKYSEILIKNSDGIDIRQGCHHIDINNITGFTEDDTVALTGLDGTLEKSFSVCGKSSDICYINVTNVSSSAFCSNVRLLNQGGVKLHDILVDKVTDTSENCTHMDRGIYGVRLGDMHMYGERHSSVGETYNITVRNVRSRGISAVQLSGSVENLKLENIMPFDGAAAIDDKRC